MKLIRDLYVNKRVHIILQLALAQIIILFSALYSIRVYTELLTPSSFGYAMMGIGVIILFDGLTSMPLSQTILSRCLDIHDPEGRRRLSLRLSKALANRLIIALTATFAILYSVHLAGFVDSLWAFSALALLLYSVFDLAKQSLFSLLIINQAYSKTAYWTAGEALITIIVTVFTIKLLRPDAVGLLAGYVLGRIISTTFFLILFSGGSHFRPIELSPDKNEIQAAVRFGLPVALMGPLGWIASYMDRYILAALLGPGATGEYAAASGLVSKPYSMTASVLSNYFRPQFYELGLKPRRRRVIIARWAVSACTIGTLGFFAFLALGPFIARLLLAPDFRSGAPAIMAVLAASQTMSIATHSADNAALSVGKSASLLRLQTALSLFTLILVPIGILFGGMIGGLIGRLVAETTKFIVTVFFALSLFPSSEPS